MSGSMISGCKNWTKLIALQVPLPDFTTLLLNEAKRVSSGSSLNSKKGKVRLRMRSTLPLVFSFLLAIVPAQADVWQHVSTSPSATQLQRVPVSKAQFDAIRNALTAGGGSRWQSCDVADGAEADWTQD